MFCDNKLQKIRLYGIFHKFTLAYSKPPKQDFKKKFTIEDRIFSITRLRKGVICRTVENPCLRCNFFKIIKKKELTWTTKLKYIYYCYRERE
jgi:hypothetical protein